MSFFFFFCKELRLRRVNPSKVHVVEATISITPLVLTTTFGHSNEKNIITSISPSIQADEYLSGVGQDLWS